MGNGALNFGMADLYPGATWDTTVLTNPEAADQQALVDDQKASAEVSQNPQKKFPIFLAIGLVLILAVVFGGAK